MMVEGEARWEGTREPNRSMAWVVFAIGTGLILVAIYQVTFAGRALNLFFLAAIIAFTLAYLALSLTAQVELSLELTDDELVFRTRELAMGQVVRDRTRRVERSRLVKVVERNAGLGVRVVRLETTGGHSLLTFPEFLEEDVHDRMVAAILAWGDQASSTPSSPEGGASSPR